MELQILVSKKGTKVVAASNLYVSLGLSKQQFSPTLKKWLGDVYQFQDGIRKPEHMKDYAKRPAREDVMDDYYLSIEFAKLVTLNSKSKVKQKFATWLHNHEDKVENAELMTTDQVLAVLELAKVMGLVSCQTACEQQHLKTYEERNNGNAANWWTFRSNMLGYSTDKLKDAMRKIGKKGEGKSQRQMLMQVDKYEMIRTGVIDLFMALGKTERYAKNLGELAKTFARELKVEIFDDREGASVFMPQLNSDLAREVREMNKTQYLQRWEARQIAS